MIKFAGKYNTKSIKVNFMIRVNSVENKWKSGMTVQDILNEQGFTFKMLAVWVNDSPVTAEEFSTTLVPDGADVQAIHLISGG